MSEDRQRSPYTNAEEIDVIENSACEVHLKGFGEDGMFVFNCIFRC